MRKELIKLISDLVVINTTENKTENKEKIVKYLEAYFKKNKIKIKKYPHKTAPSLIATIPGNIKKQIFAMAHLDVVLADPDQFKSKIKGNKMYARGARDDKGPAAMLMILLKELKNNKDRPTVNAVFTTDEEIGGTDGVGRLVNLGVFNKADLVFVPDGGDAGVVVCKEKGIIHFVIEAEGKAAHGSRPWLGENAIDNLLEAIARIKNIFASVNTRVANHWYPTINIGNISGGQSINQVPDKASAGIDLRFTEKYNIDSLIKKVRQAIKGKAKITYLHTGELLDADEKHPYVKQYVKVVGKAMNKKIKIIPEHGASDARFLNRLKVPVIIHYPEGGNIHAKDEWVNISSIEKMLDGLEKFVNSIE